MTNLTDDKKFWKTIRPKFLNKCKTANATILVENEKILQDEKAFSNYFIDATHSLCLKKKNIGLKNALSKIVNNFRNSEGIKKIKESQQAPENFHSSQ